MECPDCKKDFGVILYVDMFICDGCDDELTISYCACHVCGYTWRLKNGTFLDGNKINEETINQILEGFETALDEELANITDVLDNTFDEAAPKKHDPINYSKMSDMLHSCLKCREMAYPSSDYSFKCSVCNFEWEVLEGG